MSLRTNRKLAAVAAAGVLALIGPAAFADTIYNDLDNSIDAVHELMTLPAGTDGSTTLRIEIQGLPGHDPNDTNPDDHSGCNIQGGGHWITLTAISSDENVATVGLSNTGASNLLSDPGTLNTCDDTVLATVHAVAEGDATISFAIDAEKTSNDPSLTFGLGEATFDVHVGPAGGGGTVCGADPAAPAWAAAMLQKSGVKAGSKAYTNYVAQVAAHMGTGATFDGWEKNQHVQYETAVHDYLVVISGKTIASPGSAAPPGWECTSA